MGCGLTRVRNRPPMSLTQLSRNPNWRNLCRYEWARAGCPRWPTPLPAAPVNLSWRREGAPLSRQRRHLRRSHEPLVINLRPPSAVHRRQPVGQRGHCPPLSLLLRQGGQPRIRASRCRRGRRASQHDSLKYLSGGGRRRPGDRVLLPDGQRFHRRQQGADAHCRQL